MNDKIRAASQSNNFVTQALYQKLKTSKWTLKTVRLTGLQKLKLKSFSIFFKFVHLCLLLYLQCYNLYLLFMFWAVFLCLQWVLFLLMFDAWCSLCIKDERILCLLHKILWPMFSSPWLFFVKTRSLFQIFSSNVAHFPCYQNSLMETLLMRGFSLGVVDSIKSWRSTNIVLRKNINVILTFTDNSVKECWWFCCIICGCILELSVSHGC